MWRCNQIRCRNRSDATYIFHRGGPGGVLELRCIDHMIEHMKFRNLDNAELSTIRFLD